MTTPNVQKGPKLLATLAWILIGSYSLYLAAFSLAEESSLDSTVLGTIVIVGLVLLAALAFTAQIAAVLVEVVLLCILLCNMLTRWHE
jgi:hypothetical protein